MSLQSWAANGWLRVHQTNPQEIQELLAMVDGDLADARGDISNDWRFGIAYNAALKPCLDRVPLDAKCVEVMNVPLMLGAKNHRRGGDGPRMLEGSFRSVPGGIQQDRDRVGGGTGDDVRELAEFAEGLRQEMLAWLRPESSTTAVNENQ